MTDEQTTIQGDKPFVARWKGDDRYKISDELFFERTTTIDEVVYKRHPNGGGLVAETATVEKSVFVGVNARVSGDAQVCGNARVSGDSRVSNRKLKK